MKLGGNLLFQRRFQGLAIFSNTDAAGEAINMKRILIALTAGLIAASSVRADEIDRVQRYENSLEHIVGHAGRGATAQEVKDAIVELKWVHTNEAHFKHFSDWINAQPQ